MKKNLKVFHDPRSSFRPLGRNSPELPGPVCCGCDKYIAGPLPATLPKVFCIEKAFVVLAFHLRLQEPIRGWLDEGNFPTAKKALQVLEEADDSMQFQILFRFLFIPIWLRNYAPATLHIPVWKLLLAAIPHTLWVSFIFASLGLSLQDANDMVNHGGEIKLWDAKWQHLLMFAVSAVMSLLLSWYSYKKYAEMMSGEGKPLNENQRREP